MIIIIQLNVSHDGVNNSKETAKTKLCIGEEYLEILTSFLYTQYIDRQTLLFHLICMIFLASSSG
jgi:hypothetical protein